MRRVLISPIIPMRRIADYPGCQAATNFCLHLAEGDIFDVVYSLPPTNVRESLSKEAGAVEYVCIGRNWKSMPGKVLSVILENIILSEKINKDDTVWLYNLGWNVLLLYFLLGIKGVCRNIVVADFTPPAKKNILGLITQWFIRKANARILLADSPRFGGKNTVCIPGVVSSQRQKREDVVRREFFLSGFLIENRGFPMILEWFAKHPACRLSVCGHIPQREVLKGYTEQYENICDLGFLSYEQYVEALGNSGICLNTRDPGYPENHENFPSKMIEYLMHNKVVVSTMHYPQLEKIKYVYLPLNEEEFMNGLENLLLMDDQKILEYANQGEYVIQMFSIKRWREEIIRLESSSHA